MKTQNVTFMQILLSHILHPNPIIIWGKELGVGKTDFGLFLAEKAFEYDLTDHILTNIKVTVKHPRLHIVRSNYELDTLLDTLRGRKLLVFDEAGIIFSSRRVLSNVNMYIFELVRLARKKHCKLIFITQSLEDLDPNIRRLAVALIQKVDKKTAVLDSRLRGYRDLDITLTDISATSLKFDTYDTAEFQFLTEEELLKKRYRDKLLRILEDPDTRLMIRLLIENDFKYKDVGSVLGLTQYQVTRRIKALLKRIFKELFPELLREEIPIRHLTPQQNQETEQETEQKPTDIKTVYKNINKILLKQP